MELGVILIGMTLFLMGLGMREALVLLGALRALPPGRKVSRRHEGPVLCHLCLSVSVQIWGDGDREGLQYLA